MDRHEKARARDLDALYEFARNRNFFVKVGYQPIRSGYRITVQAGYADGPPRPVFTANFADETPIRQAIDEVARLPLDHYLGLPSPGGRR